ncbi:uncharacterized protein LOC142346306 [Convolutriloba macropyga]|uniref:uncharacterized protein LOC142346306 n=1 Tax=Convolutriloba macropyga TaxID=536237 RepID=UPI003F525D87
MLCEVCNQFLQKSSDAGKHFYSLKHLLRELVAYISSFSGFQVFNVFEIFDEFQLWTLNTALKFGISDEIFRDKEKLEKYVKENLTVDFLESKVFPAISKQETVRCLTCTINVENVSCLDHACKEAHIMKENEIFYAKCSEFFNESRHRIDKPKTGKASESLTSGDTSKAQGSRSDSISGSSGTKVSVSIPDSTMMLHEHDIKNPPARTEISVNRARSSLSNVSSAPVSEKKLEVIEGFDVRFDPLRKSNVFDCKLCGVIVPDENSKSSHLNTKRHLKKVTNLTKKTLTKYCEICESNITGAEAIEKHNEGKKHRRRLRENQKETGEKYTQDNLKPPAIQSLDKEVVTHSSTVDDENNSMRTSHVDDNGKRASGLSKARVLETIDENQVGHIAVCVKCGNSELLNVGHVNDHLASSAHNQEVVANVPRFRGLDNEKILICPNCRKNFNGPKMFDRHLKATCHINSVRENKSSKDRNRIPCICCQIVFTSESEYQMHLLSDQHKQNVWNISELVKPESKRGQKHQFECKLCEITISGLPNFRQHLDGESHLKIQRKQQQDARETKRIKLNSDEGMSGTVECNVCKRQVEPKDYTKHVQDEIANGYLFQMAAN